MRTYTTPYVFREYPKWVCGKIVKGPEEEAAVLEAAAKAEAEKAKGQPKK